MTAMDTQSTRDARGAGSGGNATGFQRSDVSEQPLSIKLTPRAAIVALISMDTGFRRHDDLYFEPICEIKP